MKKSYYLLKKVTIFIKNIFTLITNLLKKVLTSSFLQKKNKKGRYLKVLYFSKKD